MSSTGPEQPVQCTAPPVVKHGPNDRFGFPDYPDKLEVFVLEVFEKVVINVRRLKTAARAGVELNHTAQNKRGIQFIVRGKGQWWHFNRFTQNPRNDRRTRPLTSGNQYGIGETRKIREQPGVIISDTTIELRPISCR